MDKIKFYHKRFERSEKHPDTYISTTKIGQDPVIILMPRHFTRFISPSLYYDLECYPLKKGNGFAVINYKIANTHPEYLINPEYTEMNVAVKGEVNFNFRYRYPGSVSPRDFYEKNKDRFVSTFRNIKAQLTWKQALQSFCTNWNIPWELTEEYVPKLPDGMTGDIVKSKTKQHA